MCRFIGKAAEASTVAIGCSRENCSGSAQSEISGEIREVHNAGLVSLGWEPVLGSGPLIGPVPRPPAMRGWGVRGRLRVRGRSGAPWHCRRQILLPAEEPAGRLLLASPLPVAGWGLPAPIYPPARGRKRHEVTHRRFASAGFRLERPSYRPRAIKFLDECGGVGRRTPSWDLLFGLYVFAWL